MTPPESAETRAAYYAGPMVTIHLGRAEDILPTLPKSSADLVATDPPYGVNYRSNWGGEFEEIANDDGTLDWLRVLGECLRVLRRRRHLYVFGGLGFGDSAVGGRATLIWDKGATGMGDLSMPWGPAHEPIDFGVAHFSSAEREQGRGALAARLRQGSVIRVTRPTANFIHPNEKPVALMRQLIEASSCVGEMVLDPFLGSGSTAVAAVLAGRCCVGIEVEERWAELATKRVVEAERIALEAETA